VLFSGVMTVSAQQTTEYDNARHEARMALLKEIASRVPKSSAGTLGALAEAYARVVAPAGSYSK
jgi:hypothetical protein